MSSIAIFISPPAAGYARTGTSAIFSVPIGFNDGRFTIPLWFPYETQLFNVIVSRTSLNNLSVIERDGNTISPIAPGTYLINQQTWVALSVNLTNTISYDGVYQHVAQWSSLSIRLRMTDIFPNGVVPEIKPIPDRLSINTDQYGRVTFTFTDYILPSGNLYLANADDALIDEIATVTCSSGAIESYNQPISKNGSIAFKPTVLTPGTSFTGTVIISATGAGTWSTPSQISFISSAI